MIEDELGFLIVEKILLAIKEMNKKEGLWKDPGTMALPKTKLMK